MLAAFHRARGTSLPPQAQPSLPLPTRPQPQPQAPTAAISLRDIQAEEMKRHSKQQQVAAAPVQPPQDSSLREYRDEKQALAAPERSGEPDMWRTLHLMLPCLSHASSFQTVAFSLPVVTMLRQWGCGCTFCLGQQPGTAHPCFSPPHPATRHYVSWNLCHRICPF